MNVLLIGSGGREHALAWKLCASPMLTKLYAAPGNPGHRRMRPSLSRSMSPTMPRSPISAAARRSTSSWSGRRGRWWPGLADDLRAVGIRVFGPSQAAAQLEGSKGFTKDLCARYGIPTAAYGRFGSAADAKAYVAKMGAPIVVKADGLAAGKGVTVAMTLDEALEAVDRLLRRRVRRGRRGGRRRGILDRRGGELLLPVRRRDRAALRHGAGPQARSVRATPAPTPAAWAPIRRRR